MGKAFLGMEPMHSEDFLSMGNSSLIAETL